MNNPQLYESQAELIEQILAFTCRRRGLRPPASEDFASWTRIKLLEDGCGRLRKWAGQSQLSTFLVSVVQRLYLDWQNHERGKWRPSAKAKSLGREGCWLDQLIHRDGLGADAAVEELKQNRRVELSRRQLHRMAAGLPAHPPRRQVGEEPLAFHSAAGPNPEQQMLAEERQSQRAGLLRALAELRTELPIEDGLILRLRYEEGFQVKQIAARLGSEVRPLYRRLEWLKKRLQKALQELGYSGDDLD